MKILIAIVLIAACALIYLKFKKSKKAESTGDVKVPNPPVPVFGWYALTSCSDLKAPGLWTSQVAQFTFSPNERVFSAGKYYTVGAFQTSDPGGNQISVLNTGEIGCPK